jgi:hypothetical protein
MGWLRRNDPLGATIKGTIVAGVGVVFLAAGSPLVGFALLAFGVAMFAVPIWFYRRDQKRLRRWQSRRTQ